MLTQQLSETHHRSAPHRTPRTARRHAASLRQACGQPCGSCVPDPPRHAQACTHSPATDHGPVTALRLRRRFEMSKIIVPGGGIVGLAGSSVGRLLSGSSRSRITFPLFLPTCLRVAGQGRPLAGARCRTGAGSSRVRLRWSRAIAADALRGGHGCWGCGTRVLGRGLIANPFAVERA
jgi:hypothetical protein